MRYIKPRDILLELAYHRGVSETFEKDLVNYINKKNTNAPRNIKIIGNEILSKFPTTIEAQHIGSGSYDIEGDILLITEDKPINIEIKMSDSFGKGTLANVSQKLFQTINPGIIGYQDFHNGYIYEDMPFKDYCWMLVGESMGKKIRTSSEYQVLLRTLRDSDSAIVDEIVEITNGIKLEYNDYLVDELKKTPDYLYKLTFLVRLLKDGIHTYSEIKNYLSEFKKVDDYKKRSKYYVVYIYNASSSNISSEIVDYSKALDTVHSIDAVGQSLVLKNIEGQTILRFSTHWKNICQGGATPCFNIFHGNIDMTENII